jgi:predicted oxidoreductase
VAVERERKKAMKKITIGTGGPVASRIIQGCMNLGGGWDQEPVSAEAKRKADLVVRTALDVGINMFDHADIYTFNKSEEVFGQILAGDPSLREKIVLQTKCAVRFPGDPDAKAPLRYDNSAAHILRSVEGSLKRLRTDRVDILLIHRPDPLMEPEEIAGAFDRLHREGKALDFGVSNFTAAQMKLLGRALTRPLVVNQVEVHLLQIALIDEGINANMTGDQGPRTMGTMEYCQLNRITVQSWRPVCQGIVCDEAKCKSDTEKKVAGAVAELADAKKVSREAIVLAWLLRHPAGIQPVIGTLNPDHIRNCAQADAVALSREEWNRLYIAARGRNLY